MPEVWFLRSLSAGAGWSDLLYDVGVAFGALILGMVLYVSMNGLPFKIVEIDVTKLDKKNAEWCYTEKEVRERYGPNEGREFGEEVQICGARIPKSRALKFVRSGRKVADAFNKVSYEEKHALMMGMAKFPEAFVQESLKEKYQGSNGRTCDACGASVKGKHPAVCSRCKFTACELCRDDKKLGTCFCKDENFGLPYPPLRQRKFYQKGIW